MTKNNVVGNGFSLPELKTEKSTLLSRIRVIDNLIKAIGEYEEYKSSPVEDDNTSSLGNNSDLSHLSAYDGCLVLLEENGKPMTTRQLLDELAKRGKVSKADNAMTSLYSSLYGALHRKEVEKNKDGSWGLTNWKS